MTEPKAIAVKPVCRRCADAAAYLDGELDAAASDEFELHVEFCPPCASLLAGQRRLFGELDAAFNQHAAPREFTLPSDFTRVVTARAQSDMCSLRLPSEKKRALLLSLLLAVISFALLGAANFGAAFAPARVVWHTLATAFDVAGHIVLETLTGAALILRAVGGVIVASGGPGATRFLMFSLIALACVLLFRLIVKYHRAGLAD